jgi:hypothetical protein
VLTFARTVSFLFIFYHTFVFVVDHIRRRNTQYYIDGDNVQVFVRHGSNETKDQLCRVQKKNQFHKLIYRVYREHSME